MSEVEITMLVLTIPFILVLIYMGIIAIIAITAKISIKLNPSLFLFLIILSTFFPILSHTLSIIKNNITSYFFQ